MDRPRGFAHCVNVTSLALCHWSELHSRITRGTLGAPDVIRPFVCVSWKCIRLGAGPAQGCVRGRRRALPDRSASGRGVRAGRVEAQTGSAARKTPSGWCYKRP
ncbi:hypothetical protein chiPu_0005324 [Chiloscyllium punctatum]|uniref:Uncharacterized protein n=1 Tax=Chiloscyllium punctatum TaxID=137246 RepID=A0A401S942_CHIPU|nr:hypothetical protein [Chiloscyllium punctatum]